VAGQTEKTTIWRNISPTGISVYGVKNCNVIHVSCCNVVAIHFFDPTNRTINNKYLSHVPSICFDRYRVIIREVHTDVY
jgi:hypothetical protein